MTPIEIYSQAFGQLSTRAARVVGEYFPTVESLSSIVRFGMPDLRLPNCGYATMREIRRFAENVIKNIYIFSDNSTKDLDIQVIYEQLLCFLHDDSRNFINKYYPSYEKLLIDKDNGALSKLFTKDIPKYVVMELTYFVNHFDINSPRSAVYPQIFFAKELDTDRLSVRAKTCLKNGEWTNWWFLYDTVMSQGSVFRNYRNVGKKTVIEILNFVEEFSSKLDEIGTIKIADTNDYVLFCSIQGTYKETLVRQAYEQLLLSLSAIAINRIKRCYSCIEDCLNIENPKLDLSGGRAIKENALEQINSFRNDFLDRFHEIIALDSDALTAKTIQRTDTFLTDDDVAFVCDFKREYSYYPLFYLATKYIQHSQNRPEAMFRLLIGLDDEPLSREEIAQKFGLTIERVRQIFNNKSGFKIQNEIFMSPENWAHYSFIDNDYLTPENTDFVELVVREHLPFNITFSAFCYICSFSDNKFELLELNKRLDGSICSPKHVRDDFQVGCSLAYAYQQKLSSFRYFALLLDLDRKRVASRKDDEIIHVDQICCDSSYWFNRSEIKVSLVLPFVEFLIRDALGLEINDHTVTFVSNKIDIKSFLYDVLKENETPMTVDELFSAFKEKFPNHKYNESRQIRPCLADRKLFRSIGRKSLYTTNDSLEFTGNIQDAIITVLQIAGIPMKRQAICKEVVKYRADSNERSVYTNLFMLEEDGIITMYEANYVGLTELIPSYGPGFEEGIEIERQKSFAEHIDEYRLFMTSNHRTPFISGCAEEASIARWFMRTAKLEMEMTPEMLNEWMRLKHDIEEARIPTCVSEYQYKERIEQYRDFVMTNARPMNPKDENDELFRWFQKQLKSYGKLDGLCKYFFDELLDTLRCFGYDFDGFIKMYMD